MAIRIVYKASRFWRFYLLLVIAFILMTYLIYIGRNDPYLQNSFPYFRLEQKFNSIFSTSNQETIKKLMEKNVLDYELINSNAKFCFDKQSQNNLLAEDFNLLNDESIEVLNELNNKTNKASNSNVNLILIIISKAVNFRHRTAVRQTWGKYLSNLNAKFIFVVGNPFHSDNNIVQSNTVSTDNRNTKRTALNKNDNEEPTFTQQDKLELDREIKDYQDIIQIKMPDNENYTTTKTLVSFRWLQTYCQQMNYVFVLSDTAVMNHVLFEDMVVKKNVLKQFVNDESLVGMCDGNDENFAKALRLFFSDLYKSNKLVVKKDVNKVSQNVTTSQKNLPPKTNEESTVNKITLKYKGEYCRNLGWLVTANGAKKLWQTAWRSQFMMKISPFYLNGYLAYKANLKHVDLFKYYDTVPASKTSCLKIFQANPTTLLCAENFNNNNRFSSFISAWNSPAQSQIQMSKL